MKVRTKDFQRLKGENEFEFPVGITVIQGRSGSGKSSVFYAIEDCLTNPSGVADVINWDAKQAEVEIENDGGYAKWIKTASSCEYVDKDGKEYIKASKIDSRDIADLGFYFNPKGNIVNIHGEWSKLFPFEASDTEMFKLFEDIFNISSSFQIVESIKKDEQGFKAQINSINKELNDLTQQNNNLEYVLESLDKDVDKYINNLSIYQNKLKESSDKYEKMVFVRNACSPGNGMGIQSEYIKRYMNDIIIDCNKMLSYMFNGAIQLDVPVINEKQFSIPFIGPNGIVVPDVSNGSTAQKCMIGLVFACVAMMKSSQKYNIPRFDEIDGGLDQNNRITFINVLNQILDVMGSDQCIICSHNNEFDTQNTTRIRCSRMGIKIEE